MHPDVDVDVGRSCPGAHSHRLHSLDVILNRQTGLPPPGRTSVPNVSDERRQMPRAVESWELRALVACGLVLTCLMLVLASHLI
jgi:hypothetical protein